MAIDDCLAGPKILDEYNEVAAQCSVPDIRGSTYSMPQVVLHIIAGLVELCSSLAAPHLQSRHPLLAGESDAAARDGGEYGCRLGARPETFGHSFIKFAMQLA